MSGADSHHTTNLSSLIRDPFVRAAFEAAERDGLAPLAVLVDNPPSLDGGAAVASRLPSPGDPEHRQRLRAGDDALGHAATATHGREMKGVVG
jgi:hypothetical protein